MSRLANEPAVSALKISDFIGFFNMKMVGDLYRGYCPVCGEDTLRITRKSSGKRSASCENKCDRSRIMATARLMKRDLESINAPLSTYPSQREVTAESTDAAGDDFEVEPDLDHAGAGSRMTPDQWELLASQYEESLSTIRLNQLATSLGVSAEALLQIRAGWNSGDQRYTFPELNDEGQIIGISTRAEDASKLTVFGSKRGLYIPTGVLDSTGPILLPEGASDVAAAITMGLVAIGRSSAAGGRKLLAKLLTKLPKKRDIIVLGEMDASSTGNWPGKEAAIKLAEELASSLGRTVYWALPPKGKDLREYLRLSASDAMPVARGREFMDAILQRRTPVEPSSDKFELKVRSAIDLLKRPPKLEWLVENLLVRGQPAIIGGPQKALKTTLGLNLGLAMVNAGLFLGQKGFRVPKPLRVCMLSGESGEATIYRTIRQQINTVRGMDAYLNSHPNMKNLAIGFRLPQFGVPESVKATEQLLSDGKFDVLFIDPLYLCLLAGNSRAQASSIFDMGPLLMNVADICQRHGTTPILLHHFPKGKGSGKGKEYGPPELTDLAFAGAAEFARQWILISRRGVFQPDEGLHRLWITLGGSAGFASQWAVDVEQGVMNAKFEGQKWEVAVRPYSEQVTLDKQSKQKRKTEKESKQAEDDLIKIRRALKDCSEGKTKTAIAKESGIDKSRIQKVLVRLVSQKTLMTVISKNKGGEITKYKLDTTPAPKGVGYTGKEGTKGQTSSEIIAKTLPRANRPARTAKTATRPVLRKKRVPKGRLAQDAVR